jgi:CHAT domain-containing protein/tetratricopeptide (TPR) repeat protein
MSHINLKLFIEGPFVLMICMVVFTQKVIGFQSSQSTSDEKSSRKAEASLINGNYDEALKLYEQLYQKRLDSLGGNSVKVANVLNNIGAINTYLELYDKAISYYSKAEDIYTLMGDKGLISLAKVHVNLASCYLQNGDMEKARSYYENSDRIFQKLKKVNTPEYESLLINLAAFYIVNSDYNKAQKYNDLAFKISTAELKDYLKWISRGFIYNEMKDHKRSLECYNTALKVMERDHGTDYSGKEQIYNNLGTVYLNLKEYDKALECFEKSRTIVLKNSGINNASYSWCLNMIGQTYLKKTENASDLSKFLENKTKNTISALEYYQQALCAVTPGYNNPDYTNNPQIDSTIDKTQLLVSLKSKAEALGELSDLEEKAGNKESCVKNLKDALIAYQLSAKVIHLIRTGFINQESRLFLAENEHSVYTGAVNSAVHLYDLTKEKKHFEQAFEFSERSRSTDFLTMVRNTRAKQFGGMPDSLLQKETELKSEIEAYKNFVFDENTKPQRDLQKIDLWKTKIFDLEKSYSKLILLFEKQYPRYYDFKYADPIVKLEEVQSKLKPREALVEYVVAEPLNGKDGKIISFLITKNKYQIYTQNIDSTFENSVNLFLQFLKKGSVFSTGRKDYLQYSTNAYKLNNLLISPFSKELEGYQLIIIPDGKLSYLPFDAFLTSSPDTSKMDFRGLKYLVYDHAISYSYSATLLYYYFKKEKLADKELAAFVPRYDGSIIDFNIGKDSKNDQFFPLPGANLEVKGITKLIRGQIFKEDEATEENFKANAGDYDILHLAMHTVINDSLPMYSKLVFSQGTKGEEWLDTYEVYNMSLKSRLTVLSACNTGSGRLQKGEGVMSLARAFLYAGCPAIVMTLWSVEDESSANLMIDFYKNLLSGYSKDEALRKAKIKHIRQADPLKAHPYFWLGYVSIGDQRALYHTKTIYFVGMILILLLAVMIEKLYIRRKR